MTMMQLLDGSQRRREGKKRNRKDERGMIIAVATIGVPPPPSRVRERKSYTQEEKIFDAKSITCIYRKIITTKKKLSYLLRGYLWLPSAGGGESLGLFLPLPKCVVEPLA